MQLKKHNSKTPPERKPKWLRRGIALLAAIATLATGGVVASTAYAGGGGEYPWVAGVGVRYGLIGPDPARGCVMATQTLQGRGGSGDGGRPDVCDRGEGVGRLNATSRLCLSLIAYRR